MLGRYRKKGFNFRTVLIIGSRDRAREVINIIGDQLGSGFKVIGCLDLDLDDVGKSVKNGIKIIGTVEQLEIILKEEVVDEVIFAMPLKKIPDADQYIDKAEEMGVSVRIVPDWQVHALMYRPDIATVQFEDFLGVPTMAFHTTSANQGALLVKSFFDLIFAGIGFTFLLPLFIGISLAIKCLSKGPVFFRQERSGLNGRKFMVYKFRTMVAGAEDKRGELDHMNETDGPVFKIRNDPRIIPYIGTFLRKTSLDEFPQLINVLKGRDEPGGSQTPHTFRGGQIRQMAQRRRLSMKPGLTCLWQIVTNRNNITFEEWMKMDLKYIDTWSLGLDFKILFMTVRAVLNAEGR